MVGLFFGPLPTLASFVFAIGVSITLGVRALAKSLSAAPLQTYALEIFALFNPWVYNKTVACHLLMLLAYGVCFAILAELLRPVSRSRRLALLLLLTLPQLQFFLIALVAISMHAFSRRTYLPWVTGIVIALPTWIGLVFDRSTLLHTPYTLAWEASQSVDPVQAPVLMGYFANYAGHFTGVQIGAVWVLVICACFAVIAARDRLLPKFSVTAIAIFLVAATGTRGLLGSSYASIVLNFPESGLFRELYDLLAFVAIGYCILLACLPASNFRILGVASLLASTAMATAWITLPPYAFWVNAQQLPDLKIVTAPNTRFALYPAYQPMQFNGKGSGTDPDEFTRPECITPLNEYFAQYPVSVALSTFLRYGDTTPLEALSTSLIVQRPWLNTDAQSLRLQLNGATPISSTKHLTYRYLRPYPEVSLGQFPEIGSLANRVGAGNILFADARDVRSPLAPANWRAFPGLIPIRVSNAFVDETKGWIDVQFDFVAHPELGQGVGGAVTTSVDALLKVRGGTATLVNVKGTLLSQDNRVVSRTTRGYEWIRLADNVAALRCAGRCVVAGQAEFRRIPALNPATRSYSAASFTILAPWLVRVDIPAHAPPVLRYNVAYDWNWKAFAPGKIATHLRLDATINGWLLPSSSTSYRLYLVHGVALAQAVAELLGSLWILAIVLTGCRPLMRALRLFMAKGRR